MGLGASKDVCPHAVWAIVHEPSGLESENLSTKERRLEVKARIVCEEGVLGGIPVVEGTRVPADNVLAEVRAGKSAMEVFRHYPSLPLDGIEACIRWDDAGRLLDRSD